MKSFKEICQFKGKEEKEEEGFGKGKISINGKYIGKNIVKHEKKDLWFIDDFDNEYKKEDKNLIIRYSENKSREKLIIKDFEEGHYGLWLEEKAPYYYEDGYIIRRSSEEKKTLTEIENLNIEENKYLFEEERIIDDFLWIGKDDKINFADGTDLNYYDEVVKYCEENNKKADNVSLEFIKSYYADKGNKEKILYDEAISILKKSDLSIFKFVNSSIIYFENKMEHTEENKKYLNGIKEHFNKSIQNLGNYRKEGYIEDNTIEAESNYEILEKYMNYFNKRFPVNTMQGKHFFESFLKEEREQREKEAEKEKLRKSEDAHMKAEKERHEKIDRDLAKLREEELKGMTNLRKQHKEAGRLRNNS